MNAAIFCQLLECIINLIGSTKPKQLQTSASATRIFWLTALWKCASATSLHGSCKPDIYACATGTLYQGIVAEGNLRNTASAKVFSVKRRTKVRVKHCSRNAKWHTYTCEFVIAFAPLRSAAACEKEFRVLYGT